MLLAGLWLLTAQWALAQATGEIGGTIVDGGGRPIPGVTVLATAPVMPGPVTVISDRNGRFLLADLPPGEYALAFTREGYEPARLEGLAMAAGPGSAAKLTIRLAPAKAVPAPGRGNLSERLLRQLPGGRTFESRLAALPGVLPLASGGLAVDGASAAENVFLLDGADVTGLLSGGQMVSPVLDFIDEVRVTSGGYPASLAGATGGVIEIITRGGDEVFHGELFGYYSGSALRAGYRDLLALDLEDDTKAKYYPYEEFYGRSHDHRVEGGLALGGSLFRDKLWLFGAVSPVSLSGTRTITPYGVPQTDWEWRRRETQWHVQAKLTARLWPNLRLSSTFLSNFARVRGDLSQASIFSTASVADKANASGFDYPNLAACASLDWEIASAVRLSLRAGFSRTNQNHQRDRLSEPCFQFLTEAPGGYFHTTNIGLLDVPVSYQRPTGWINYPRSTASEIKASVDQRLTLGGDLGGFFSLGGDHAWQAGAQFKRQGQRYDHSTSYPILFFGWNRDFIAYGQNYGRGKYGYYGVRGNELTGPYGDYYHAFSNTWALYAQDAWTVGGRFTLNLGLRAESEYIPYYSDHPSVAGQRALDFSLGDKLSPRLGFAWFVDRDLNWKATGSYAIHYDTVKLSWAASSLGGFQWQSAYYALDTYEWDKIGVNGYYPGRLLHPAKTIDYRIPTLDNVDPALKPSSTREITLGLERRFDGPWTASLRLVQKHLRYNIEDFGVLTSEGGIYFMANPGYGVTRPESQGGKFDDHYPAIPRARREYWGVTLAFDKSFSNRWQGGLSLTWSSLRGDTTGPMQPRYTEIDRSLPSTEPVFEMWHLYYDRDLHPIDGALPGDRPLVVKAYGTYTFPCGLSAGAVVRALSGQANSTEWRILEGRFLPYNRSNDLGRSPLLVVADLYLEYALRLGKATVTASLNVDNLFDIRTATRLYPSFNQGEVSVSDEVFMSGHWDIADYEPYLDPRYGKKTDYYGNPGCGGTPRQARLGVRCSF